MPPHHELEIHYHLTFAGLHLQHGHFNIEGTYSRKAVLGWIVEQHPAALKATHIAYEVKEQGRGGRVAERKGEASGEELRLLLLG